MGRGAGKEFPTPIPPKTTGAAQQRMGQVKSTIMSPGKAEQVGLELLKARAGTEP